MFEFIASFFVKLMAEARWRRFYRRVDILLPDGSKMGWKRKQRADRYGEWQARLRRNYGAETEGGLCSVKFPDSPGGEVAAWVSPLPKKDGGGR